jgi:hypothetical protein
VSQTRLVILALFVVTAGLATVAGWRAIAPATPSVLFRSHVADGVELLLGYANMKAPSTADRMIFGDVTGTLCYAFVSAGAEPAWIVEAEHYPDAYRGFELIRAADGRVSVRDVARGHAWTVDVQSRTLRRCDN